MDFFNSIDAALSEYKIETITHCRNKSYNIALSNIYYFKDFGTNILFCAQYNIGPISDDQGALFQKPGLIIFYDNYIAYSNKVGLYKALQGKIDYKDIQEISVIQRDNPFFGSYILFFLKNNIKLTFNLNSLVSHYILRKIINNSEANFPFRYIVARLSRQKKKLILMSQIF